MPEPVTVNYLITKSNLTISNPGKELVLPPWFRTLVAKTFVRSSLFKRYLIKFWAHINNSCHVSRYNICCDWNIWPACEYFSKDSCSRLSHPSFEQYLPKTLKPAPWRVHPPPPTQVPTLQYLVNGLFSVHVGTLFPLRRRMRWDTAWVSRLKLVCTVWWCCSFFSIL